jgi:hypothetical protein
MFFQNTNETADLVLGNFVTIGVFIEKGRLESNSSAQVISGKCCHLVAVFYHLVRCSLDFDLPWGTFRST